MIKFVCFAGLSLLLIFPSLAFSKELGLVEFGLGSGTLAFSVDQPQPQSGDNFAMVELNTGLMSDNVIAKVGLVYSYAEGVLPNEHLRQEGVFTGDPEYRNYSGALLITAGRTFFNNKFRLEGFIPVTSFSHLVLKEGDKERDSTTGGLIIDDKAYGSFSHIGIQAGFVFQNKFYIRYGIRKIAFPWILSDTEDAKCDGDCNSGMLFHVLTFGMTSN